MGKSGKKGSSGAANVRLAPSLTLDQALALADQHAQGGRLREAEAVCHEVLRTRPHCAPALHLLGIVTYQRGNLPAAIDLVRRATVADGTVAIYHCNLCELYRLAGQGDSALAAGRRALALNPNLAQAHNNVGIVHYERAEFDEAITHYRRATALSPAYVEAFSNLGNALRAQKKYDEALIAYRQALQLRPGFVDALNNLGTTLRDMGRRQEAEATYRRALALKPDSPNVLNNLALALKDRDQFEEANALLTRSLMLDTNNAKTLACVALIGIAQKRIADAQIAAERALAIDAKEPAALNAMGLVRFEQQNSEAALEFFRRALAINPELGDAHNNIGNLLKENGELAAAIDAFKRAIEIDPRETGYYINYSDVHKFAEGDKHLVAMEELARDTGNVVGTSRSRLDFALAKAYDDLGRYDEAFACLREANALKRLRIDYDEAAMHAYFDGVRAIFDRHLVARGGGHDSSLPIFIVGMPRSGTTLVEQILASHAAVHGAGELSDFSIFVNQMAGSDGPFRYPQDAAALTGDQLKALGNTYVEALQRRAPGAERITDKMPANFFYLGMIHMALPQARIIHVMRDARDCCLSCFSKLFSGEQNFTYELGELGRYYRKYAELMAHWRAVLPQERMLEVRYEEVIADIEGAARRILDYCGLAWDPNCVAFHEVRRPVRTASASQVRQPVYRTSEGRWRTYERHLAPLLAALGDAVGAAASPAMPEGSR